MSNKCQSPYEDELKMNQYQIQSSNETLKSKIPNQVQDSVRHDREVILNSFQNPALNFDIPLNFGFCHLTILV
jgi:hypothetical protein